MMAAVDWHQKCHGGTESKAILRHCDKDMREQDRHKNKHIDKTKTKYNWQMFHGYNEACERLNDKLDELDRQPKANKRKDRVTMLSLEVPAPDGLPVDKFHEWHQKVIGILQAMYGDDLYFVNSYEHVDEIHEYKDATTGKTVTSRAHGHECLVPLKDGKLNAKAFCSRRNINRLNKEIQLMTQEDYGLDFMTGEKKKSKHTVDELKAKSEIKEWEDRIHEYLTKNSYFPKVTVKAEFEEFMKSYPVGNGRMLYDVFNEAYNTFSREKTHNLMDEAIKATEVQEEPVKATEIQEEPVRKRHKPVEKPVSPPVEPASLRTVSDQQRTNAEIDAEIDAMLAALHRDDDDMQKDG